MAQLPAKEVEKFAEEHIPLLRHMIFNCLRSYRTKWGKEFGELIICTDNKSWRHEVFSQYKAHRKTDRAASKINWTLIFNTLYEIQRDLVASFPYRVLNVRGAEADDIIAVLCEYFAANEFEQTSLFNDTPQDILIVSGDKDFIQLAKYQNVKQYSPILKKWLKPKTTWQNQLRELIIRGDKSDGIPNFKSPDNSIVDGTRQKPIYDKDMTNYLSKKPDKFCVNDEYSWFKRNEQLIDFINIPDKVKKDILLAYQAFKPAPRSNIRAYFIQHKMRNMIEAVGDF
jgi:hypothetical protein